MSTFIPAYHAVLNMVSLFLGCFHACPSFLVEIFEFPLSPCVHAYVFALLFGCAWGYPYSYVAICFSVSVKWQKELFPAVEIDTTQPPYIFKCQLYDLTGVPPERQKIMVKGGLLKVWGCKSFHFLPYRLCQPSSV